MDLCEAYASVTFETRRLLKMGESWSKELADQPEPAVRRRSYQPKQAEPLATRIGEAGVAKLVASFRRGARKQDLAEHYGCSLSSIERLLRQRGVRRWTRRSTSAGKREQPQQDR